MRRRGSFNIHALLYVLAGVVLASGLARYLLTGGGSMGRKIQITFWNGFTGPDGIVMLGIIDKFNSENPNIHVTMQRIPWATYYNKLTVAGSDGRAPSLFICHADALPRVRRAGFIDVANDVYEGPDGIDPHDFDPYVMNRVRFKEGLLGVPLDIHPQGMYCNADMLKAAGIVDKDGGPHAPQTKEEFLRALQAMTIEPGGARSDKQWGYSMTAWGANHRALMAQFDGRYLDDKGNAVVNCKENVEALEFLGQLAKENKVPPPSNGLGWFGFRQGKIGMVWDGVYMLGDLKRVDTFDYIGAPIPVIGHHLGTVANSHVMCIRKGLNLETRAAVVKFIRYVSNHDLDWADAGQVPARVSLRNTARFKSMQVQYAFSKQIPFMQYPPKTPTIFDFILQMDMAAEKVVRGQATAQQALDDANKACQDLIDRDRAEHPEDQQ